MLDMMNFNFYNVDLENAVQSNHQLRHPSELPQERKNSLKIYAKEKVLNRLYSLHTRKSVSGRT